jgi:hypothetical protein
MNTPDFSRSVWRKSSHSMDNGGQCVEAAFAGGAVGVRDSKDVKGSVLVFSRREWGAFLADARAGEFGGR